MGDIGKKKGFTLIEIVVVMAILAVLAVLIVSAISIAKEQTKYADARAEMRDIKTVMQAYIGKTGKLPPGYDAWTMNDPIVSGTITSWKNVVNAMKNAEIISQDIADRYYEDPWGNPYAYDNNYGQYHTTYGFSSSSPFCTRGTDGRKGNNGVGAWGSGDDYCDDIEHRGAEICFWAIPAGSTCP